MARRPGPDSELGRAAPGRGSVRTTRRGSRTTEPWIPPMSQTHRDHSLHHPRKPHYGGSTGGLCYRGVLLFQGQVLPTSTAQVVLVSHFGLTCLRASMSTCVAVPRLPIHSVVMKRHSRAVKIHLKQHVYPSHNMQGLKMDEARHPLFQPPNGKICIKP